MLVLATRQSRCNVLKLHCTDADACPFPVLLEYTSQKHPAVWRKERSCGVFFVRFSSAAQTPTQATYLLVSIAGGSAIAASDGPKTGPTWVPPWVPKHSLRHSHSVFFIIEIAWWWSYSHWPTTHLWGKNKPTLVWQICCYSLLDSWAFLFGPWLVSSCFRRMMHCESIYIDVCLYQRILQKAR